MAPNPHASETGCFGRGALIVFEGLDRSGKSTQSKLLQESLQSAGIKASHMRFPDRTTESGKKIDEYLQSKTDLDDQTIHLLFSKNRREAEGTIRSRLMSGETIVADRYAYSGVAFSSAKGLDLEWCKRPDKGLPAADLVIYLNIAVEEAASRGGFGEERYEKIDFQRKVEEAFRELQKGRSNWKKLDARLSVEELRKRIMDEVREAIDRARMGPIRELWSESESESESEGRDDELVEEDHARTGAITTRQDAA